MGGDDECDNRFAITQRGSAMIDIDLDIGMAARAHDGHCRAFSSIDHARMCQYVQNEKTRLVYLVCRGAGR